MTKIFVQSKCRNAASLMMTFSPDHFGQAWAVDKIAEVGNPGKGRKGIHSIPEHL